MFRYLWNVLRHKWFVFVEACKLGIPLLGIVHDLSKFRPREFVPYARYFAKGKLDSGRTDAAFDCAWLEHQKANRHHWQYWVLMNDNPRARWFVQEMSVENPPILARDGKPLLWCEYDRDDDAIHTQANIILRDVCAMLNKLQPLPMPDRYRREMLADWRGAGRAYGNPDTAGWYNENKAQIVLHKDTRDWIETQLGLQ